jgi:hypothetical protein
MERQQTDIAGKDLADLYLFTRAWGIRKEGERYVYSRASQATLNEGESKQRLRTAFYAFRNGITYLKNLVPGYLQESLTSQQHAPAIGLYMVFLRLYEKAQRRLNQFTQRHLDFYYRQVLIAKPLARQPESAYLHFRATAGTRNVLIEAATEFTCGKDRDLKEIAFKTVHDLVLNDARIRDLRALYLQHDGLISPETELGYVTRIKTINPPVSVPGEAPDALSSWALFGPPPTARGGDDAELGFAVASPLLLLQEGKRSVELSIFLGDRQTIDADGLIANLSRAVKPGEFMSQCGKIFSHYLLCGQTWLSSRNKQEITYRAEAVLDDSLAKGIANLLNQDWQVLFYKLFKNAFSIKLTGETGWLEISEYVVTPLRADRKPAAGGLKISFTLGQEAPPVRPCLEAVHGKTFAVEAPLLHCCINPQTSFYPYSLFENLVIDKLRLQVDVKGVRNILAYNQHGQLDPSKPFQPFGPLPACNDYFVFSNYEIAIKRLTNLKLNLEWAGLPGGSGGLSRYYRDYPGDYSNSDFKGRFEVLIDGAWRGREGEAARSVRLFDTDRVDGGVRKDRVLDMDLVDDLKTPDQILSEVDFGYGIKTRNGFIRFMLTEPAGVFGHGIYPETLTRVLSQNARLKKPLATPNPPYTPIISQISLDYVAHVEIIPGLSGNGVKDAPTDTLLHIHPFGVETIYPGVHDKPVNLLPQYPYQGNLFIGIDATALAGPLSLFFYLAEDLVRDCSLEHPQLDWFYLAGDGWRRLSAHHIHRDSTNGFLSSGILTLDIPADIQRGGAIMPGNLYWLRVSVREDLYGFCSCYAILPHAVNLSRVLADGYSPQQSLTDVKQWQPMSTLTGIDGVWQAGKVILGQDGETGKQLTTRLSERLRHKNRALTAWDYEHMILQRFPDVSKVKCFMHMTSASKQPRPGHVLLVVVPQLQPGISSGCERLMFSSVRLASIRAFIEQAVSPFVEIEVRNPVYEQVQVRCTVKFTESLNSGFYINQLDRDISDFICPWRDAGYRTRFGWSIQQKDIESYLRELDYVEFFSNFSMLHITQDSEHQYSLEDTAKDQLGARVAIGPRHPWSLAIPAGHHFIETMSTARIIEPEVTGVDELEVGNTFIIVGKSGYGEKE